MQSPAKTIGILGGMGPLATSMLFENIVTLTQAPTDQDHIPVLVDNNPAIPDRTAHIVANGEDPRPALIQTARHLETMGADLLIMPCNTAHYFFEDITPHIHIPFLHMVKETARHVAKTAPGTKKVGILATEGTCKAGVYDTAFAAFDIQTVTPDTRHQKAVTDLIYGIKGGEKGDLAGFLATVESLRETGVEIFVLGCTELSVARKLCGFSGAFIDPLTVIAKAAIKAAGKPVLP